MYFKNLEAEKARRKVTDADLADVLGLRFRENFTKKKNAGTFTIAEGEKLAKYFGMTMDYLFEHDD